jgi:hypothetical protein
VYGAKEKKSRYVSLASLIVSRAGCTRRYIDQKLARKGDARFMPEKLGIYDSGMSRCTLCSECVACACL